ncbi:MAG: PorT family protein [Muribaculaceae bacterium]|nr:PorT family protein [Muribaculaceae bacterium]
MKKILLFFAVSSMAIGANAQFVRFGVKAGLGLNSIHLNNLSADFESENRTGFTGGVMMEVDTKIGLCADVSAMYTRRSGAVDKTEIGVRDYLSVPVNIKYKMSLPAVQAVAAPYLFTGPEFAFNIGKSKSEDGSKYKKCVMNWNVGVGVELLKHVQVSAAYSLGLGNSITNVLNIPGVDSGAKDRCWTLTAAYLF